MKLRIPDKIAAAKELVQVCECAKPDRVELSATDTLGDFINSIRKAERPRQHVMDYAEDNGERRGRVIARTPAATAALQLPGRPAAGICACRAADPVLRYRPAPYPSRGSAGAKAGH